MNIDNITVCSLTEMTSLGLSQKPTHLISLTRNNVPTFPWVTDYLRLAFDDLSEDSPAAALAGYSGPTYQHVEAIVAFCKTIPVEAKTLIHCDAGVSRSTAAFLMLMTVRYGISHMMGYYGTILSARPVMHPNKLMIKYADHILGCNDKLNRLCQAIQLRKPSLLIGV